jgi:hypothetical protein
MSARHLQAVEDVVGTRLSTREEVEAWVADRRRVLGELVEREGLGRQLALDDERQAA